MEGGVESLPAYMGLESWGKLMARSRVGMGEESLMVVR